MFILEKELTFETANTSAAGRFFFPAKGKTPPRPEERRRFFRRPALSRASGAFPKKKPPPCNPAAGGYGMAALFPVSRFRAPGANFAMLSFSTCWNSSRHTSGEAMVEEILALGVDTIEISHGLKVSLLPGIQKAFREGKVKVSGVHNFCPSPVELMIDAPDAYEFTSHRKHDRERAMALTLKTLQFASEFEAKYVVLHLGSVPLRGRQQKLADMAAAGKQNTREYVREKLKLVRDRESIGGLYFRRAKEALQQIAEAAEKYGVPVAVESRSHYEQVPTEREMVQLMEECAGPWVGYWHDFGHVQLKANVGLLDHREWLERMRPYLIGAHFHDVIWPDRDHRVPFQGSVDYDALLPLVPPEKPIVWELSHRRRTRDIKEALPVWKERYAAWV